MRTLALTALLALALGGCDTISDTVDGAACAASGYADTGTVSATVGTARYNTPCVRVDEAAGQLTIASIDNVVSDDDQRLLAVTIPTETGTFTIGQQRAAAVYTERAADAATTAAQTYAATGGSITVTSVSGSAAEGSFTVTVRNPGGDEIAVSSGRFDVAF